MTLGSITRIVFLLTAFVLMPVALVAGNHKEQKEMESALTLENSFDNTT